MIRLDCHPRAPSVHETRLGTPSSDPMSIVFRRAGAASRRRKKVRRTLAMLGIAAGLLDVAGCGSGDGTAAHNGGQQHLVTQYFAIFNDGATDNFHACLDLNPPYELWDMTFIAFLHTYRVGDVYVADYENAR